jgi:hypothetical protein
MTRPAGGATLALALGLVAGCGHSTAAPLKPPATAQARPAAASKPKAPSDRDALQTLLLERSRAIQDGDAARLAATSTGAQQARDRRQAAAAGALPLFSVELTAASTEITGRTATLRVETQYSFDDADSSFLVHSTMALTKTPAGWRVQRDRPSGIEAPWQRGRFAAHRSAHFLALTPRGLHASGFMADLEAGRRKMTKALPGVRAPRRIVVLVARDYNDAKALTRDAHSPESLTAIAEAAVDQEGPAKRMKAFDGQRLLIIWRSFGRQDHAGRRMVVAHELTHASLVRRTSGRTPAWLVEGTAMYASGDRRYGDAGALLSGAQLRDRSKQAAAKRTLSLTALGKPTSLDQLGSVPVLFAYSYSAAAAFAIAARHGRAGLLRLYDGFSDERIKGRAGRRLMDRVMRRTLHESFSAAQREVDAFARAHAQTG